MYVRCRRMRPRDVGKAVAIVAADPVVGPRYGNAISELSAVWLSLLGTESVRTIVLEYPSGTGAEIVGVGLSAFVSDDFFRELKTPPFCWAGPEMTRRIARGDSPLLTNKEVREANSNGGLNVVVWEGTVAQAAQIMPEVHSAMLAGFLEQHRGFLVKELLGHGTSVVGLEATFRMGNLFLSSADGSYIDYMERTPQELLSIPHFIGISRERAHGRLGTWIGSVFAYHAPRFGLRPSEQRLLLAALQGGTDEDLADELGVSLSAVKKTWRSIYERVASSDEGLIPASEQDGGCERGKEKKQRLLAYLRDHPEELRPAAF
jgi:DNA-binding CsgD family transcriptional regulator